MPEQETKNPPAASAIPVAAPAASAQPARKQFDVALVDPHNPTIEHWPRTRVTIEAASVADLPEGERLPQADESAASCEKRILFSLAEVERNRAITAYNKFFGLTDSHLRYDLVPAAPGSAAPTMPPAWMRHLKAVGLAR